MADVGCGLGAGSVLMAQAYPRAVVSGSDYHVESIGIATKRAAEAGLAERVRFEVAAATTFSGTGYDLVTTFGCLHDGACPTRSRSTATGRWGTRRARRRSSR